MGIQINGNTDTITAIDGALTVSGAELSAVTNLNATGIITATSFSGPLTGNVTGNLTGNLSGNVNAGVVTATSNIVVGNSFIRSTSIGIGTTTTIGRNSGVGTATGTLIFNSDTKSLQIYIENSWNNASMDFLATGGTVTTEGLYAVHTFTHPNTQSFVVISGTKTVEAEVLGGGGSGSSGNSQWAGGGGGGGYAYASKVISPGTYPVNVGVGATRQSSCGSNGNMGVSSSALGFIGRGGSGGINGASPTPGGTYSIPDGIDLGSSNGGTGPGSSGDGSGGGGNNGKRVANPSFTSWGGGAAGVPNGSPGNNATGYGNGGGGGHSCQGGHNGGGSGSPGIVVIKYLLST